MTANKRWTTVFPVLAALLAAFLTQGCATTKEPLLGFDFLRVQDNRLDGRKLTARIAEVDDVGDIWILGANAFRDKYLQPVMRAEWHNVEGWAEGDLTKFLDQGANYVIFTLFNRVYKGWSPTSSGGKFRAKFDLFLDGQPVYAQKLYRDYNEEKLIFAAIFKVNTEKDGRIRMLRLSDEEKEKTTEFVRTAIARVLHDTSAEVNIDWSTGGFRTVIQDPEVKKIFDELGKLGRGTP